MTTKYGKFCLGCVIFSLFGILFTVCGAESGNKDIAKAEQLISKKRYKPAISKLAKVRKSSKSSRDDRGKATVLEAMSYRMIEKPAKALELLDNLKFGQPKEYALERGKAYLAVKKYKNACKTPVHYLKSAPLLFYPAVWVRCQSYFKLKKYLKCIEDCQILIRGIPKVYKYSENKELCDILAKAQALLKKAQELYEIELYGQDYVWYRLGREAEFNGNTRKAIDYYAKIRSGILKDAGKCYTGHCLERMGQRKEAIKTYLDLNKEHPYGLYTAEALYHAAILTYLSKKNSVPACIKLISKVNDWYGKITGELKGKILLDGINDAVKRDIISVAPRAYLANDDCGNLIRTKQYPGSINNHLTAPWYLPALFTKAQFFYGYLQQENKEPLKAVQAYRAGCSLSKKSKIVADSNIIGYLLEGVVNNGCFLSKESLDKLSTKYEKEIKLGWFFYVSENESWANIMFKNLYKESGMRSNDRGAVLLGKAFCDISSGKDKGKAEKLLAKVAFNSKYKRLPIGRFANFLYGCHFSSDQAKREKVYEAFESVASGHKDSLSAKALLAMALCAVNSSDKETALRICKRLDKEFGQTKFALTADTLTAWINDGAKGMKKRKRGKVTGHSRTIIVPGHTNWHASTEGRKAGDLIRYKIRCIHRNNCKIIRAFKINITEREPQPPPAQGNEIIFLRAPILYVQNLEYNFDKHFKTPESK